MDFIKKAKRKIILYGIDVLCFALIYFLAYLSNELIGANDAFENFGAQLLHFFLFVALITASRAVCRVYSNVWRYVNCRAYIELVFADALGGGLALLLSMLLRNFIAYVSAWKCMAIVASFCLLSLILRFIYQEMHRRSSSSKVFSEGEKKKIAIIGAGMIGSHLAEELLCYKGSKYTPVFFIDSDMRKVGSRVSGLPVYADGEVALEKIKAHGVTDLIVAIGQLDLEKMQSIFDFYEQTDCKIKVYDFPCKDDTDPGSKRVIREIKIEDLLFRDAIKLVDSSTKDFYKGKTVLVTGGGGSIGSELCRQIAKCGPKKLVIFDIYENNAYDIQQELVLKYGDKLNLEVEIGSVRDRARLECLFDYHRPNIVFHAAAHKHVPLMERSNCEAIKNNVFGTYNTADMAEKYGVEKFILISTDKAVNPTNVMGASKRMCEMVVQCRTDSNTVFSAVRFGNVIGSNGSVIPLFNRQIAAGGPITITDKRIVRYFMTIPEASGLVMQAGAMARRGELFVLDMGKPVKIIDLAINMIRFSGLEPYKDIEIKEIGLRPGEKLYEELLVKKGELNKTENELIFIEREAPLSRAEVEQKIEILRSAVTEHENELTSPAITLALKSVVPTFVDPDEINSSAENSEEIRSTASSDS